MPFCQKDQERRYGGGDQNCDMGSIKGAVAQLQYFRQKTLPRERQKNMIRADDCRVRCEQEEARRRQDHSYFQPEAADDPS